jgi:hypothetical protein
MMLIKILHDPGQCLRFSQGIHLNPKYVVMVPEILRDERELLEAVHYLPSVSIIVPFEPKMSAKSDLEYRLKIITEKVEKELTQNYPVEKTALIMQKIRTLTRHLDYSTYKRSIALFVSPLFEKIYYLDIPVEEKVIIDESFEIRDLVYSKKEIHKYLILVVSSERSRIFLGNTVQFMRLSSIAHEHAAAFKHDTSERVSNFSDPSEQREISMNKFLHHVDNSLGVILNASPLPLFVMGTERTIGHFKKISRYTNRITGYVHGNFDEAPETVIRKVIAPHVADWKKIKQEDLLHQLDAALGARKLAVGVQEVWRQALSQKGRLLIVEKNYIYACRKSDDGLAIFNKNEINETPFYIKDAVDDIIEKILQSGGDVEFVDAGMLKDYQQIALIQYY